MTVLLMRSFSDKNHNFRLRKLLAQCLLDDGIPPEQVLKITRHFPEHAQLNKKMLGDIKQYMFDQAPLYTEMLEEVIQQLLHIDNVP